MADVTPDATKGRPVAKPRALDAPAYCLRLREDGTWIIVDTAAGQTIATYRKYGKIEATYADTVPHGTDPLAAMAEQAKTREAFVVAMLRAAGQDPDDHVTTFLAVNLLDAAAMLGRRVARKRPTQPAG